MDEQTIDPPSPEAPRFGTDVFVSYAREDQPYVRGLVASLDARGKRVWVDWAEIPPSAEWMAEIRAAIEAADAFVVILTPASAASRVCAAELDYAVSASKRIIPVLAAGVDGLEVPSELAKRNWVTGTEGPAAATAELIRALETDLDHVRTHTRLLVKAREWAAREEERSLLVRGRELTEAETWLTGAGSKEPPPTPLHTRFLLASRAAATRRQRGAISGVTAMFLVAAFLGVIALDQRNAAVDQRALAESRALGARAMMEVDADPELALLLGLEAERFARTDAAIAAIRTAVGAHHLEARTDLELERIDETGFLDVADAAETVAVLGGSPDADEPYVGQMALYGTDDLSPLTPATEARVPSVALALSPDGSLVAGADGIVEVATGTTVARVGGVGAFDPTGRWFATCCADRKLTVYAVGSWGRPVRTVEVPERIVFDVEFAPTGDELVVGHSDGLTFVDVEEGRVTATTGYRSVIDTAYGGDPAVVASTDGGPVRFVDPETGREVGVIEPDGVMYWRSVAFSPDGRSLAVSEPWGASVWALDVRSNRTGITGVSGRRIARFVGSAAPNLDFAPDGSVITLDVRGALSRWRFDAIAPDDAGARWLVVSPDGTHRVTGGGPHVRIEDLAAGSGTVTVSLEGDLLPAAAPHCSSRGYGYNLRPEFAEDGGSIWVQVGDCLVRLAMDGSVVGVVDPVDPYGEPEELSIRAWDRSGDDGVVAALVDTWSDEAEDYVTDLVVAGGGGAELVVEGVQEGDRAVLSLDPAGQVVAFATNDGVTLHDIDGGAEDRTLLLPGQVAQGLGFDPMGDRLAVLTDRGELSIIDASSGRVLRTIRTGGGIAGFSEWNSSVTFGGDRLLVTSDESRTQFWDSVGGTLLWEVPFGADAIRFLTDGRILLSRSGDDALWVRCDACLPTAELLDLARSRVTRALTPEERATYLGEGEQPP